MGHGAVRLGQPFRVLTGGFLVVHPYRSDPPEPVLGFVSVGLEGHARMANSADRQKLFVRCAVTRPDSESAKNGVEIGSEFFNVCSRGKITVRNSLAQPSGQCLLEKLA